MSACLKGLVLAGGKSRRMGRDKALMSYHGKPQGEAVGELLAPLTEEVFLSCRAGQYPAEAFPGLRRLEDPREGLGPLGGILAGFAQDPEAAWLVVACDLPLLNREVLETLIAGRDASGLVTAFRSAHDGLPEPLCAIYEPGARAVLLESAERDVRCPRKILIQQAERVRLLAFEEGNPLDNINSEADLERIRRAL